jgi:hypothetical protein
LRNLSSGDFSAIMAGLATENLAQLTKDLAAQLTSETQQHLLTATIDHWARQDVTAAFHALKDLPSELVQPAIFGLGTRIGQGYIAGLPLADQLELLPQVLAGYQPDRKKFPFGNQAAQGLYQSIASEAPEQALAALVADPAADEQSLRAVFLTWTAQHPAAAAEGIAQLPADKQQSATKHVIERWVALDPMAASVWAHSLPAGGNYDQAANGLATALAAREPSSAFAWASSVTAPERNLNVLQQVLKSWADPTAASAAIDAAPNLNEPTKSACREYLDKLTP